MFLGFTQASSDLVNQLAQCLLELVDIGDVLWESVLARHALLFAVQFQFACIFAPCEAMQVAGGMLAHNGGELLFWRVLQIRDGVDSELVQLALGYATHSPDATDG